MTPANGASRPLKLHIINAMPHNSPIAALNKYVALNQDNATTFNAQDATMVFSY